MDYGDTNRECEIYMLCVFLTSLASFPYRFVREICIVAVVVVVVVGGGGGGSEYPCSMHAVVVFVAAAAADTGKRTRRARTNRCDGYKLSRPNGRPTARSAVASTFLKGCRSSLRGETIHRQTHTHTLAHTF